jgi:hypothetical protein
LADFGYDDLLMVEDYAGGVGFDLVPGGESDCGCVVLFSAQPVATGAID